jgi:hypothetical protein
MWANAQVLWFKRKYSTWMQVTEDSRDPDNLVLIFTLLRSVRLAARRLA